MDTEGMQSLERQAGNLFSFIRKEPILVISGILAALSCLAVPPSAAYLTYINWRTLALLFCMMAIVAGASGAGVFQWIGRKITEGITDQRRLSRALMLLCFVLAMFITNDVTLVTIVPLTMLLMKEARERTLILTLVQETIAANLGSMVTPFGNPQNLYLSSFYGIRTERFLQLMLPYALLSLGLLLLQSVLIPKGSVCREKLENDMKRSLLKGSIGADVSAAAFSNNASVGSVSAGNKNESGLETMPDRTRNWALYGILFAGAVLAVLRVLNIWCLLAVVIMVLLVHDRRALCKVNYSLLLTFVFFFILIGNLGNVHEIRGAILSMLQGHELLASVLASQVVSNVPAAILLSGFTREGEMLVVGTNLGGLGTIIASMASIITFQMYAGRKNAQTARYFGEFTLWNCLDLAALLVLAWSMHLPIL